MADVHIEEVYPDKAFYRPGEAAQFIVRLTNERQQPARLRAVVRIHSLAREVARLEKMIVALPGTYPQWVTWVPPVESPVGYGVDVEVVDDDGIVVDVASTAFDVLERWTQSPRYGFLSNFSPGRDDIAETMDWLVRYHINGLQFYDWMYRHENLLTPQEPYSDPLGRRLSRRTVDALVEAAHRRNIAAMPYTAIYGASEPFFQAHPDWALYNAEGQPIPFGEHFLYIMNPDPASPWTQHLMTEFAEVLQKTAFDGIHLDQYGDPKAGFDSQGNPVPLADVIPEFINLTKKVVTEVRPDGAVVFNAVDNWPIETVAPTRQDFVYIEVWPPHTLYQDLWDLIAKAQHLGGNKPVVLAAYIDPDQARNVRLADAVIFASGGYHIELGERGGMLADPYFPKYKTMTPELADILRRYYDFAVRYENVLSIGTRDTTVEHAGRVSIEGVSTDSARATDKVWPIVRQGDRVVTINLINLMGISSPEWNGALRAGPTPLEDLTVHYTTDRPVERVWFASPDQRSPAPVHLEFAITLDSEGHRISFSLPRLEYWDMVVVEFAR